MNEEKTVALNSGDDISPLGKGIPRKDALGKVTGSAVFVNDIYPDNMLIARTIRSPHPHAEIAGISLEGLKNFKEQVHWATWRDIPGRNVVPLILMDEPFLAKEVVRFAGEPVMLVACENEDTLDRAEQAVRIEYREVPAVLETLDAMKEGAPRIYGENNIFSHHKIRKGNVESGFKKSYLIHEETYTTPYQEHAYLETQGMIAVRTPEGGIEVRGSMQCPFYVRDALSSILGLPLSRVKVVQTTTGGAFGGKEDVPSIVAGHAALLAWKTGRAVKLIYSREEDIESMSKRHPGIIKIKAGVDRNGLLRALDINYVLDGGAYATLSPVVLWRGTIHAAGPYKCSNVKVDSFAVATNKVPCGAFRGFGSPQVLFAIESHMDEISCMMNIDPLEFRRRNLLKKGDRTSTNQVLRESFGLEQTLTQALERSGWFEKRRKYENEKNGTKRKGIGISTIFYGVGLGAAGKHMSRTGAYVQLESDGSATFSVGTTEMGQGMETVLSQIVAQELGIPYSKVTMNPVDTTRVPDSGPTVASRATTFSGNALMDACAKIRNNLLNAASRQLGISQQRLNITGDKIVDIENPDLESMTVLETISLCTKARMDLAAHGFHREKHQVWDPETGIGDAYIIYSYATKIAEVEVDLDTGEVALLEITSAHDVGRAINPQQVEAQIQGGAVQGAGYALMEKIVHEKGKITSNSFTTYIIPTSLDAPLVNAVIVEDAFPQGPYGAKGFGEQPLMGVAPAVANAIRHAAGIRLLELPATPENVLKLLEKNEELNAKKPE